MPVAASMQILDPPGNISHSVTEHVTGCLVVSIVLFWVSLVISSTLLQGVQQYLSSCSGIFSNI